MEPKDDPVWFAQQLVDTLRREVTQKEAELERLVSHRALLLQAFSTPTFPPGYTPPGAGNVENSNKLNDRSNARHGLTSDEPGPSGRYPIQKSANNPAGRVTWNIPPPPQRLSPPPHDNASQDSDSESETSDDSTDVRPTTTKEQDRNQAPRSATVSLDAAAAGRVPPRSSDDSEESSESTEVEVLPSVVNKKFKPRQNFPVVNWTQEIKKRTAASLSECSSSESDDSVSSDASTEEGPSKSVELNDTGKTATPASRITKVAAQAQTLSSEAPPEDHFDWELLGISGPWCPARSSSLLADSSWSQLQKQQSLPPCQFRSMDEYRSSFEGFIFEECKAHLNSFWDLYKTPQVGAGQNIPEMRGVPEDRGQESLWQFRPMYPSADDPFKYVEAEVLDGSNTRLDPSEVVLLALDNKKMLAVVTLTSYKGVLLRTRLELPAAGGQCGLLRMANMVTLKRQYVSLCRATEIWDPLQRQLLNPLESCISPPIVSSAEEDVKVNSSIKTVRAWKKEGLFNKKQRSAVEAVLRLQRGFLLVQGPPGTGKTSTIVGMVSAVRIEEPRARILVCASSNAAVDEIVSRLMHRMLDISGNYYTPERGTLIRVGVEKSIQTACLPVSLDKVLQSNTSASNSGTGRRDTIAGASIVCCTISGSGHQTFDEINQKFDLLIIDEAAQAQENEVLIALQRVKGRCIMVGDPCQLPAVVMQRPGKAYGRSLFERMQEAGRPVHLMTTQYRMHPLISQFPSATFYGRRLKDSRQSKSMLPIFKGKNQEMGIDICGYSFKLGAYCFLDVTWGVEQGEVVGHSISNTDEAEVVATVVQGVVRSLKAGMEPNIGVITPYLAQRSLIMQNLERYGIDENACEVNTVDGFQGREKDVVILSCVRAQAEHGLGFVSDVRRMNVALTRARHSLIIVGHAETLRRQSPAWNALIEDASARDVYQILCHKPKTMKMEARLKDAGGQRANFANETPQHTNQRRFDQGGTGLRPGSGHQPSHAKFEQRTRLPKGNVMQSRSEQVPGIRQDLDQARFIEHRAGTPPAARRHGRMSEEYRGPLSSTEAGHRPSHIRFEEVDDVGSGPLQPSSHTSSKPPLSTICDLAMGPSNLGSTGKPRKHGGLKRKADHDDTGYDQAEGSKVRQGKQIKVKLEQEDHCTRTGGGPAIAAVPVAPVVPAARQMRGQIDSNWKGPDFYTSHSLGTTALKVERKDVCHLNLGQTTENRGSGPVEPEPYYRRDNDTAMEFSEERKGRNHTSHRGRGRGHHKGPGRSNYKGNRRDVLDREQNVHTDIREDRYGGRHGNSPSRNQSFNGSYRRRGDFNTSNARQ